MEKHRPLRRFMPIFSLLGIGSLIWFLVRVIPKPSRAAYPCMRVAAPVASTFVLWLLGAGTSLLFVRRAREYLRHSRYVLAAGAIVAGGIAGGTFMSMPHSRAQAAITPNAPVGVAKGAKPGRVVWVYDSAVTDWKGLGNGHWWSNNHTKQRVCDTMLSHALCQLSGKVKDSAAWDTLFRYFNAQHGRGSKGYAAGEKIAIKINLTLCNRGSWCVVDTTTYKLVKELDYMYTNPQVARSLLRQLVKVVKVNQTDIYMGDPSCYYPNELYDSCHAEFPNVHYVDCSGKFGRTKAVFSDTPMYWSCRPTGVIQDRIPSHYVAATYVINLANLKSHAGNGVTLCAKNHYGSFIRLPTDSGYYSLHQSLAFMDSGKGRYRSLVDILGQRHIGGKTLLSIVDGIYEGNHNNDTAAHKWPGVAPFNGGYTCSMFASQDPVAIECVCYDLMQLDPDPYKYSKMTAADDYLTEAAQANNPPSGTFYDPNHATATTRLASLGVCEHWNNATSRQYSRNLSTSGTGIELVYVHEYTAVRPATPAAAAFPGYALRSMTDASAIEFRLPAAGTIRLALLDYRGRIVGTVAAGVMSAGRHRVNLPGALAAGQYIAALYGRIGGADRLVTSCPVMVVR